MSVGRKRKNVERYPNGDIHHSNYEPAILHRTLERRAEVVGWDNVKSQKAGVLIGQMELTGRVVPEQYLAACRAGYFWGMSEKILGVELNAPRRNIPCVQFYGLSAGVPHMDLEDEKKDEIMNEVMAMDEVLKKNIKPWVLAKGILSDVVMDERLPPSMQGVSYSPFYERHWELFRSSLSILADHWGIKNIS